jgi:hypothetical protein
VQLQCLQRAPERRVTEKSQLSKLIVGLAGTGDQTRATWVAGSGSNRSAIHYDSSSKYRLGKLLTGVVVVPSRLDSWLN